MKGYLLLCMLALALSAHQTHAKSPGVVDSIKNFLGWTTTTTTTTEDPSKTANPDDPWGMYGGMYPGMGMMDPGMFGDYGGYYDADGNKIDGDDDKNEELRKKK